MGASRACDAGPGYPLVSFLPPAKKDTASIPCAGRKRKNHHDDTMIFVYSQAGLMPKNPLF
jgi:hypothetical protein